MDGGAVSYELFRSNVAQSSGSFRLVLPNPASDKPTTSADGEHMASGVDPGGVQHPNVAR
jgi:hypothetical protein